MNKEEFIKELAKLNITITENQLAQLDTYYQFLISENKKYNLTNITEKGSVYLKHFYDSVTIVKSTNLKDQYICDIGTGAGFPGMVLKIMFPNIKIDLLEATGKKCEFLHQLIKKLGLTEIKIINDRAEIYSKKVREQYDIVTCRAVAPLKHLLEYSVPLLKIGGKFIALKSNLDSETLNIDNYYQKLFIKEEKIIKFKLPVEESNRTIYEVVKIAATPSIYPRQYNQIKKKEI